MIFAKAVKTMPESRSCYKGHCLQNPNMKTQNSVLYNKNESTDNSFRQMTE